MEHEHSREAIHRRFAAGPKQSYLRDWVYGGIDGTVTTFAIVSGVVGAHLAPRIILILGGASLIADGFAMAAANYLATRSEHEELQYAEAVERRHIEAVPDGEREEVREILRSLGLIGELLDRVVAVITSDRDRWVRLMIRDEYVCWLSCVRRGGRHPGDWWGRSGDSVRHRRLASPADALIGCFAE